LLLALCAAFAPKSEARQITFAFTGTVTSVQGWECQNLPNLVQVGDDFTGTYTFESDSVGEPSGTGVVHNGAVTAGSFTVGALSGVGSSGGFYVENGSDGDTYHPIINLPGGNDADPCTPWSFDLFLGDQSGQMLSSTALPTTPPALPSDSAFEVRVAHDDSVRGVITSLTLVGEDTTAPTVNSVDADPDRLWPPNGKLVDVTVAADITDDDSGVASATLIIDDEYNEFDGEVELGYDEESGLWGATIQLRAWRNGKDKSDGGRSYMLTVRATDAADNVSDPTDMDTEVLVPHDQRNCSKLKHKVKKMLEAIRHRVACGKVRKPARPVKGRGRK
jgi:hypothetical protein